MDKNVLKLHVKTLIQLMCSATIGIIDDGKKENIDNIKKEIKNLSIVQYLSKYSEINHFFPKEVNITDKENNEYKINLTNKIIKSYYETNRKSYVSNDGLCLIAEYCNFIIQDWDTFSNLEL